MTKELTKQQQNELNILKGWILKWAKLLKISRYGKNFGIEQFYKNFMGTRVVMGIQFILLWKILKN